MLTEIEQQGAAEMLNQHRVQVRVQQNHAGVSRFEKHTRASGITALSLRPESWHKNVDGLEWLSASIVHDLRNPLGAIYAAAEMLMDLDLGLTEVQRLATDILRAARHIQELLADVTNFAYGNTPAAEMCDIRDVIAAASNAAWPAADSHSIQIVLEVPEGVVY